MREFILQTGETIKSFIMLAGIAFVGVVICVAAIAFAAYAMFSDTDVTME